MVLPIGNEFIPYDTPYHVVELVIQLLKETFSSLPEDYPLHFDNDDYSKSGILIDTAYNKESKIIGKPLLIVTRAGQSSNVTVLGDLAKQFPPVLGADRKYQSTLIQSGLQVRILSKIHAEVEIISQHVFGFIMCCRTMLNKLTGIHMITDVSLSETNRYDQDTEMYSAQCMFNYVMQAKWSSITSRDILQGVNFSINK